MRTTRRTRLATAAVIAPLALTLAACGGDADDTAGAGATTTVTASPTTSPTAATPTDDGASAGTTAPPTVSSGSAAAGSLQAAAEVALTAADGQVFTVDRDDAGWEVSIVGADGIDREVGVAADTSGVTRGPIDDGDDDGDDRAERERLLDVELDYLAAIAAAQASVPDGTVTGVDLDEDDGRATWDVQFDEDTPQETVVDVDANTGEVLRTERYD